MRFVRNPILRDFSRSHNLLFLVAAATIVTPKVPGATRDVDGTGSVRGPAGSDYRVVASAPGVEIRANARNVYTRVYTPDPAAGTSMGSGPPHDQAAVGSSAVTLPAWQPFPLYGGTITAIDVSPVDPNFILAGLKHAYFSGIICQSHDGGVTWSPVELSPPTPASWDNGYVNDIEFIADGTAYVATDNMALRRKPNGEWSAVRDLPYEYYSEIAINPVNTSEIWLAGNNSYYVPPGSTRYRFWRSRDGGTTWDDVTPPTGEMRCTGIAFKTTDPAIVVASFSFNGGTLWRSPDGGATWTAQMSLTSNYTDVVYDGSRFVASAEWLNTGGIFASDDDGLTWTRLNRNSWPSNQVYDLDTDPLQPGVVLASTLRGPFIFSGGSWRFQPGGARKQATASSLFPGDPNRFLIGQELEGVLRSVDGGASFVVSSTGLLGLDVYGVAQNPLNPLDISVAFQALNSGGLYRSLDGGVTWALDPVLTARMGDLEYAPDGTLYAYADIAINSAMPEGIYRRSPNSVSWTPLGPFGSPLYFDDEIRCIRVDPLNPNTVIISGLHWPGVTAGIWRSTNRGVSWTRVYTAAAEGGGSYYGVGDIQYVNDGTGATLMAADPDRGVLHSADGGMTWSSDENLPTTAVGDFLRGTPADPGTFYLVGYYRPTGYVTRNGGMTWSSFQTGEGLLSFGTDLHDPNILYGRAVPTSVVRSTDGGVSFSPFDEGSPLTSSHDFSWLEGPCQKLLNLTGAGLYFREIDSTPPDMSVVLDPAELWPPNHKLRTIRATVTVTDVCDASASFVLTSIMIEDRNNPGCHEPDIIAALGTPCIEFKLRAERSGAGTGRRYLVTYTASDAAGNSRDVTAVVQVPHDMCDHNSVTLESPDESRPAPLTTELVSVQPNPFNPSTTVVFSTAHPQFVTVDILDVRGARVRNLVSGALPAGTHRIPWNGVDHNGRRAASGVYFFRFAAGSHVQTMKALLIK